MPRAIWKGVITFGMVSIPVQLYPATQDKDVSFHLLHKPDHSRIKFKRWCVAEDREVEQDELVKAFEVSKDQYVEITDEDLEKLPLPARHTIELSAFVSASPSATKKACVRYGRWMERSCWKRCTIQTRSASAMTHCPT